MKPYHHFHIFIWLAVPLMNAGAQTLPAPSEMEGAQIGWGSNMFGVNYMSDGVTTFETSGEAIRFELGTFVPGFDPRTASPEEWLTNWVSLQGEDYDLLDQQVIQTATLSSNDSPFHEGAQAYIWGYTTKDLSIGAEWIIVGAPEWKFPSKDTPTPSGFSMGDATPEDALIGYVNPANGTYHMQFQFIPEPSASLLTAASLTLLLVRRRREA